MSFQGSSRGFLLLTMRMLLPFTLMWLSSSILQKDIRGFRDPEERGTLLSLLRCRRKSMNLKNRGLIVRGVFESF